MRTPRRRARGPGRRRPRPARPRAARRASRRLRGVPRSPGGPARDPVTRRDPRADRAAGPGLARCPAADCGRGSAARAQSRMAGLVAARRHGRRRRRRDRGSHPLHRTGRPRPELRRRAIRPITRAGPPPRRWRRSRGRTPPRSGRSSSASGTAHPIPARDVLTSNLALVDEAIAESRSAVEADPDAAIAARAAARRPGPEAHPASDDGRPGAGRRLTRRARVADAAARRIEERRACAPQRASGQRLSERPAAAPRGSDVAERVATAADTARGVAPARRATCLRGSPGDQHDNGERP